MKTETIETHRLHHKPLRQLSRHELPASHQLEDWETDDDTWFRKDGQIYNVKEFCTVGMPRISGPFGGSQIASNGEFLIAASAGELHSVITVSETCFVKDTV